MRFFCTLSKIPRTTRIASRLPYQKKAYEANVIHRKAPFPIEFSVNCTFRAIRVIRDSHVAPHADTVTAHVNYQEMKRNQFRRDPRGADVFQQITTR